MTMAKYLVRATLTSAGVNGLLKEGGSSRREAVKALAEGAGGSLEAFYFAFGDDDVYAILELPDSVSAAAASLAVNGSGIVSSKIVVLLTPEEVDEATKKTVAYRAPGA
jgi:uncharacterized protein with GYD domain